MRTIGKILIFLFILIAGVSGLAFYWTFYKPLPDYQSTKSLEVLRDSVNIHWDKDGVPHIYAQNEHDLYLSLGYVHAQDRLWQMTLSQLSAEGRFAEFLGEELVTFDKYQRTLGIWEVSKKIERSLPDSTRSVLAAYTKGVNAFLENNTKRLPVQFSLTGMDPIPWTITHSIAMARMMGWQLNVSWWTEVMYGHLQEKLDSTRFSQLTAGLESYPAIDTDNSGPGGASSSLINTLNTELALREMLKQTGSGVGSNAWVADGSRTESGFPLLAGDPHLGLNMPGTWYEAHLNLDDRNLSGATLAGAPIVVVGQNDFLAWSLTNIMADDTDFFTEKMNPEDRGQYVVDSANGEAVYESFDISREIIKIKGGGEELLQIRKTKHGPVISDIYENDSLTKNQLISFQWTGHKVTHEIDALLSINWADSFSEFKAALPGFKVPGQNFMYADQTGNIGMFSVGAIPVRSYNPILPRKGWDPSYDWQGFVPFDELPRTVNPDNGWIANANNRHYGEDYPHYLATFWEPASRIKRITEQLSQNDSLTVEDFQSLQNDIYSHHAKNVTEFILPILNENDTLRNFKTAISYLENWNYLYEPNATAASIMDTFFLRLTENALKDEIGPDVFGNFLHMENVPVRTIRHLLQRDTSSILFDDVTTESIVENREIMIVKSMEEALAFLEKTYGDEPFQWRWEQLHTITLPPPFFSRAAEQPDASKTLKVIVENMLSMGPFPVGGHGLTVNNTQYDWSDPYGVTLGPSIRRVVDLSDLSKTWSILPTGQSGRPLSTHFGDQTQQWVDGEYRFFYQDSTLFSRAYIQTMKLSPAD